MKERLKRLAPRLGYPAFYLLCFVVFLLWTFPWDKVRDRVVAQFNAQQRTSSNPSELRIEELDSHWLTGVKAKGVKLVSPPMEPGKPPVEIKIDEARARVAVLGLLVGNTDVSFAIDAAGGSVKGTFESSSKQRVVDLTFEDVDLARVEAIAQAVGFPLDGKLNGTLALTLPEGKASKASGAVNLEIKDMYAGGAKELTVKTPLGPFTLPRLKVGNFSVTGQANDGVLKLSKIGATGGDVDVAGDGRVQLREMATDAHLDVNLKFKVNDAYRSKNDKTKMLFGTPGGKEKPMLEMDPKMASSKTQDGFYQLRITNTLAKPDVKPAGGGVPANPFGGSSSGGGFNSK